MTSEDAFTELVAATAALRHARQDLAYHRGLAAHGMRNSLDFCVSREHVAFHRWERASAACAKVQPAPTPKPITAPKVVAAAPTLPSPPPPSPERTLDDLEAEAMEARRVRLARERDIEQARLHAMRRESALRELGR